MGGGGNDGGGVWYGWGDGRSAKDRCMDVEERWKVADRVEERRVTEVCVCVCGQGNRRKVGGGDVGEDKGMGRTKSGSVGGVYIR